MDFEELTTMFQDAIDLATNEIDRLSPETRASVEQTAIIGPREHADWNRARRSAYVDQKIGRTVSEWVEDMLGHTPQFFNSHPLPIRIVAMHVVASFTPRRDA